MLLLLLLLPPPLSTRPVTAPAQDPPYPEERYGLEKANANMGSFTAAPGLKASLFAAEPMIQNPTSLDIDPRGRVWAAECVNYRRNLRPEGDRVVILEDSDDDGLADRETTFYQSPEMINPLGLCVLPQPEGGTKVIVSAGLTVWLLTDKDGDDKAEDAAPLFLTKSRSEHDHQIHAFQFGLDGKFYFDFGDFVQGLMWPDGSVVKDLEGREITAQGQPFRRGMLLRCDIDLKSGKASNVEVMGHNFRNNYKACTDSFGTIWQSDNDDDGNLAVRINYVMEHGNYGYMDEFTGAGPQAARVNFESDLPARHWHQTDPGVVPNLLITGAGAPTGIIVNEGQGLGPAFANQLIHSDTGPRVTRAYPVTKSGAGYTASMVNVLTSTDDWYRPSDVAIAPDGGLLIADWYDDVVGSHLMTDAVPGKMMGRIYRVALPNLAKAPVPDFSTAEGAAVALTSPNRATQYAAWSALHAMGAAAEPALNTLFKDANPRFRARALSLLTQLPGGGGAVKYLTAGLRDAEEDVRICALRLWVVLEKTRGFDPAPLEADQALMESLLRDTPGVRRQIALSLRGEKQAAPVWALLADQYDGKDRWYLEALGIGAAGNDDAFLDAWLATVNRNWNTPAGREIIWRLRAERCAGFLADILEDPATPAADRPRYLRAFDFLPPGVARTAALLRLADSGKLDPTLTLAALHGLKGSAADPAVTAVVKRVYTRVQGTAGIIGLVETFALTGHTSELLSLAAKAPADPASADAIRLALADPESGKLLSAALTGHDGAALITVLSGNGTRPACDALLSVLSDAAQSPELRKAAVLGLARTQTGAEMLVTLAKEEKLPEELKLTASGGLRSVQYPGLAAEIDALFPLPQTKDGKPLPSLAELAAQTGDAARGKEIFAKPETTCLLCHRAEPGIGADVGPGLSEIGSKLGKEALFEAILNPNAGIAMGYEAWLLTFQDGGSAVGVIRSETKDEILLALPGGAMQKLAPAAVVKREKLPTSLMPAGLSAALSETDLVDLVAYLSSLMKK